MYSPWTDGKIGNWASNSKGVCSMTGYARIAGDDPLDLLVTPLGTTMGPPGPFAGRYPAGSLVHRGSWYYGTYIVHEDVGSDGKPRDLLGPFVGFRVSRDFGVTWEKELFTAERTIFGETLNPTQPIKVGSPRFVDLGQELAHSPDGKAYMVSFGALRSHGHLSWILGDAVYLGRAEPARLSLPEAWEWYAGVGEWSPRLDDANPIFAWPRHVGQVAMTYNPGLKRYLMCISFGKDSAATTSYILDAPTMTGPWRVAGFWPSFGSQAYFLNFPSRFIDADGGRAWLCYSANHTDHYKQSATLPEDPPGSCYALCLYETLFHAH
jgi:hypothetical protein